MIEADRYIASRLQRFARDIGLGETLGGASQRRRVDQLLMRLEPGHMGVAEHREPRRREPRRQRGRARDILARLMGQTVHQIEIQRLDAAAAQ